MNRRLNIAVLGQFPAGSSLAHAINVVKTAGGFARHGHRVTVMCQRPIDPARENDVARDYAEPGLEWCFAPRALSPINGDPSLAFAAWAVGECRVRRVDLVYARHFQGALEAADAGLPTVLETHAHPGDPNPMLERCFLASRGVGSRASTFSIAPPGLRAIVTISRRLRDHYIARGALAGGVHVIPDGVDADLFARPSRLSSRPIEFEPDRKTVVYAGHLYDYKGIPTLLDAAALVPEVDIHLLGGLPDDVERVRARSVGLGLANVQVLGARPHADVPPYLWHADALVLPPSGLHPSAAWTSPVKLGEYLASGTPVVASDIPALRDWVDEPAVRWFAPDDVQSLADGIRGAIRETPTVRDQRRDLSLTLVRRLSYASRARAILDAARHETVRITEVAA